MNAKPFLRTISFVPSESHSACYDRQRACGFGTGPLAPPNRLVGKACLRPPFLIIIPSTSSLPSFPSSSSSSSSFSSFLRGSREAASRPTASLLPAVCVVNRYGRPPPPPEAIQSPDDDAARRVQQDAGSSSTASLHCDSTRDRGTRKKNKRNEQPNADGMPRLSLSLSLRPNVAVSRFIDGILMRFGRGKVIRSVRSAGVDPEAMIFFFT